MLKFLSLFFLLVSSVAFADAPLIWNGAYARFLTSTGWELSGGKKYIDLSVNPSSGGGLAAPIGSLGVRSNAGAGELWLKTAAGNTAWTNLSNVSTGDVVGPSSSTDNAITRFDGTTGKLLQNSLASINDSGTVTAPIFTASSAGTGALPSLSFPTSGTNAGMYFGANGSTFTYNGADIAYYTAIVWGSGVPINLRGSSAATAPGLWFSNDNTTGFYRSAANQWGWSASNSQVVNFSSAGIDVTGAVTSSGTSTFANIIDSGLTASQVVGTDSGKQLVSIAITGTGNVVLATGPTISNPIVGTQSQGDSSTKAASTAYVDTAVSNNSIAKQGCVYATAAALPANTYSNGSSGVGATLTGVSFGALSVDGNAVVAGQRILVKNEATQANNGIYTVTTVGAVATLYVLTRATDYNTTAEVVNGTTTFIDSGSTLTASTWAMNNTATITIGTTSVTFAQIAGPGSTSAGTGLTLTGSTLSVNTSQNITKLSNMTSNGYVKTGSSDGTLSTQAVAIPVADGGTGQTSYTDGQILIGNSSGNTLTKATLTAGSNVTITNSGGGITIAASSGAPAAISYSYVYLDTGNGHGSTNTKVRRYATTTGIRANVGSAFTVTQSSTNGDKVTFNETGTYIICSGDTGASGPLDSGIVLNGANGTTDINSLTYAQGFRSGSVINGGNSTSGCAYATPAVNDYFWVQDNAAMDGTANTSWLVAVKVSAASESNIYVQNGSGHGSTNTKIRTFTNIRSNNGGSDISYNTSATLGDNFTINTAGNYFVCYADANSAGAGFGGITVNDQALTTSLSSTSFLLGTRAYGAAGSIANGTFAPCYTDWFKVGDVIRAHDDNGNNQTDVTSFFSIVKLGNTTDASISYLNNGNGHGSTSTRVRKYSTVAKVVDSNATVNQSTVEGDTNYAAADGIYILCSNDQVAGGTPTSGFAINDILGTTNVGSLAYSDGLRGIVKTATTNTSSTLCVPVYLPTGNRAYLVDDGGNSQTDFRSYFTMKRAY